jgi:hypothetical protein
VRGEDGGPPRQERPADTIEDTADHNSISPPTTLTDGTVIYLLTFLTTEINRLHAANDRHEAILEAVLGTAAAILSRADHERLTGALTAEVDKWAPRKGVRPWRR